MRPWKIHESRDFHLVNKAALNVQTVVLIIDHCCGRVYVAKVLIENSMR